MSVARRRWRRRGDPASARRSVRSARSQRRFSASDSASRRGPVKAIVAVEHAILIATWNMITNGAFYSDPGGDFYTRLMNRPGFCAGSDRTKGKRPSAHRSIRTMAIPLRPPVILLAPPRRASAGWDYAPSALLEDVLEDETSSVRYRFVGKHPDAYRQHILDGAKPQVIDKHPDVVGIAAARGEDLHRQQMLRRRGRHAQTGMVKHPPG